MTIKADSPEEYLKQLPDERKPAMNSLREIILKNLPEGFEEVISYGMIGYVVPHSIYPKGYHVNPKLPLPLINLASQKNYIALHHMGLYADKNLYEWFVSEYPKYTKGKPDIGKGCIRFKKADEIPFDLVALLAKKITPEEWVRSYESAFIKK